MKAIALVSGGLDSLLAAKVIQEQNIELIPVNFKIPFCHRSGDPLSRLSEYLNAPLCSIDISSDFMQLIAEPRYGFGSNMNPCIDCKILMFSRARKLMEEEGAGFVISGEVLAQRPMSQHRKALELIEKKSGLSGFLLRPLSAKLLAETIPEKEGWVSRDKLLNFSGRGRRPQMELAERLQMKDYAQPSGGCLLTDPEFSKRLNEIIVHRELSLDNVELLKLGRHFRICEQAKLVVGRNQKENEEIASLAKDGDYLFMPDESTPGPTSLARGEFTPDLIELACKITCRYCDSKDQGLDIIYRHMPQEVRSMHVKPIDEDKLQTYRI